MVEAEQKGEMRFFPPGAPDTGLVARSPKQVAEMGFGVYAPGLNDVFGPGAEEEYLAAWKSRLKAEPKREG